MQYEAKFIIPHLDHELETELVKAFGGFTRVDGEGGWYDAKAHKTVREPVLIYTVALWRSNGVEQSAPIGGFATLREIAMRYARKHEQSALYIVNTFGQVEIIDLKEHENG